MTEDTEKPTAYVVHLESAIEVLSLLLNALKELQTKAPLASLTPLGEGLKIAHKETPKEQFVT